MNIIVCMKQVPDTHEIRIDPIKNTLVRAGVPSIMNPHDRNALEAALVLKDTCGATVTALSMGPGQANAMLREALSLGADAAYLVTDRAFGGSDTYATSYILSAAIRHLGCFDAVFGGTQALDGDTGQTMPSLAEHLGTSLLTCVSELTVTETRMIVTRQLEEGSEITEAELPVVCTFMKESNKPRYATLERKLLSMSADIPEINLHDIASLIDTTHIGLKGSPTRVKSTFVPPRLAHGMFVEGTPRVMAKTLIDELTLSRIL